MIGTTLKIIIILVLIIFTGYLSMAELAVVSIRKAKMQKYLDEGNKNAQIVLTYFLLLSCLLKIFNSSSSLFSTKPNEAIPIVIKTTPIIEPTSNVKSPHQIIAQINKASEPEQLQIGDEIESSIYLKPI